MTVEKFYKDKFALVIDLRAAEDSKTGHGKRIGVQLQITKTATTKNVVCNIFIIGDGVVNFKNRDFKNSIMW